MDRDFEEISVEETLQRHKKILSDFASKNKLYVAEILEEVVSGEALSARPQMQQCLELVNTGEYAGVICMDHERLSRGSGFDSGYITQIFQVNHCKIVTPVKTFDLTNESDEQFSDMKFMFSRYELKAITRRLVRGREQSAAEGKFLGSVPPFGYEIYKLPGEKGNSLKIVPEQAKIVKLIFDLYTEKNMGYETIQHQLNHVLHIPPVHGQEWTKTFIVKIIRNVTYCGKIRWQYQPQTKTIVDRVLVKKRFKNSNYKIYDGLHEAIITEEQFEKASNIRNSRPRPSVCVNRKLQNPFATLLYCKKCGQPIKRNVDYSRSTLPWYRCPSRTCDCRTTKCITIEKAIVEQMSKWLEGYEITIENRHNDNLVDDSIPSAIDLIQRELIALEAQQNKICELLEKNVYTVEMFQKRNDSLNRKIDKLLTDKNDLAKRLEEQKKVESSATNIIPTAHQLLDNYENLNAEEKNNLWQQILEKIEYYRSPNSETFEIELFPKVQR